MKDTLIFSLGSFGSKIILFFMVPLYTNYLTTEEYGTGSGDSFKVMLIDSLNGIKPIIESNNYISE